MEAGLLGQLSECSLPGCEQTTGLGFTEDSRGKAVTHGVWRAEKCPGDLRVYLPEWSLPKSQSLLTQMHFYFVANYLI